MRSARKPILILALLCLCSLAGQSPTAAQGWANGCLNRRAITIDHTKVPNTDQANFAVLISGTYSYLATTANGGSVMNANGYDILFAADANGLNPLPFEQENYSPSTGAIVYWVKLPTVSHTADTVFYLFYGNSSISANQSNKTVVWDANYKGVWHLPNGSNLSGADSTSNASNLTNNNITAATSGQIDGAASFNGSNNYLSNTSLSIPAGSSITISFWNYVTGSSVQPSAAFTIGGSDNPNRISAHAPWSDGTLYWDFGNYSGGGRISTSYSSYVGSWTHVVLEYNAANTTHYIYLNGSLAASNVNSSAPQNTQTGIDIGAWPSSSYYHRGSIDEFRVSTIARSADWIATEYQNQSSPSTFYSVGSAAQGTMSVSITQLTPSTANLGDSVLIQGTNFGATQAGSTAFLNGTSLVVRTWSDTGIDVFVPVGTSTGYFTVTVGGQTAISPLFTVRPIQSGWSDGDIGPVGLAGSGSYSSATLTMQGAGFGTANTSTTDSFHFVYQPLSGDGTIVARVVSLQGTVYPEAGVMIRETLDQASAHAYMCTFGGTSRLFYRTATGGANSNDADGNGTPPFWVKLIRTGSAFNGYTSPDGVNWTQVGTSHTIDMAQNVYVGLAVSSYSTSAFATATFDNVSVTVGTTPFVTGVSPELGGIGTSVTITGSNFGATQGTSTVSFNGAQATSVTSWSSTQIAATVPSTAPPGSGPVTVTVNSITSPSNIMFNVIKPAISSLTPPAAQVGASITLNGVGFGLSQGTSQVQFNGVTAGVSSWGDTSITATVPLNATSGPVTLTEDGITSNGVQFTVSQALSVTGISPSFGPPGTSVTITGTGFGATQSNSVLTFYGITATVTSWSDTQIVGVVPSGAASGPVSVGVGSIVNWGPSFTLTFRVQLTDSLANSTTYISELISGKWVPASSQGSGCSSCTLRGTISYTYDIQGRPLSRMDENGHNTTSYTYDSNGNVNSVTAPIASGTYATTLYTSNSFGEVLTTTDPLGNVTTNTYDSNGNLLTVTTPAPNGSTAASVTTFTYDSKGELLTITDPLNNKTTIAYFPTGLIQTITDAQNNVTTYGYDAHGNRTSAKDANNQTTTFAYDSGDRLKTITYPDSTTTTFAYDYRGRRTNVTDQNGKATSYTYDDADRLLTVTDAANNVTTYGYDTENNLTSIKDANNNTTSFTYDAFGRVTKTTFPSGYIETYGYDAVGNLTSKTDRKNQLITYTYDQLNRLTQKSYPDTTAMNYTYDNDSRLTQVADSTGTYQFTFDNMGRLTYTTTSYAFLTGRNFTTSYAYDAASNRTGFTDPENGATSYVYDTLNRLQTLTPPAAFSGAGNFGFSYDALSRRTQMTRPNGLKSVYAYDNLSRLQSVLHQSGSTTLDGAAYAVDNAGNRTSRTPQPSGTASNYAYDVIYQLTGVTQGSTTTESYTYDPVGNRLSSLGVSPYSNNTSNELTSIPGTTYTYDYNGNTSTKVVGSNTTTYAWDYENRMTSVTLPGSGGTVTFKYDPFGRRIYKSSSSGTSVFAYDGDNLIEETNAAGAVVARYEQTQNIDEPLAMLRSSATSYYHADGLGSISSLSNAAGSIANTYTYDSFGKLTASTGSLVNPFRYTARESDTETGLYYYRARYYDPTTGRFIGEDPAIFEGGLNFYPYVDNNPANYFDPIGLQKRKSRKKPKPPIDPCPKEKRCFFNWLDGPLGQAARDLDTTKTLMFTMAAKEGGWTPDALAHNMPLNNPFGVNNIKNGRAVGNKQYPSLPAAIDSWEHSSAGQRVRGDQDVSDFIHDLQHPDPPELPYNTASKDDYDNQFEKDYQAVVKFMKLCGINP